MVFLGASEGDQGAKAVIIGVPFDGTSSYRAGARFGPDAIRQGSQSLETYSPFLHRDLEEIIVSDIGDITVPAGNAGRTIDIVYDKIKGYLAQEIAPIILGGEHTISIGAVRALLEVYPNLHLLQMDAHTDLRDDYLGEKYSHATVMKRLLDHIPLQRTFRLGVRAGTKEEFELANLSPVVEVNDRNVERLLLSIPPKVPLYITLDMDVFDPSLVPGVGNPEPLGLTYREFIQLARGICHHNVIGFDVVELSPEYDASGVSAIVAASVVRELILGAWG